MSSIDPIRSKPMSGRLHVPGGPYAFIMAGALAAYAAISWLILKAMGSPPVRVRFDPTELIQAPLAVRIHVAGAVAAVMIGLILLRGVKGTRLHRVLGYGWIVAMAATAISSFFITILIPHHFSPIHALSAWTMIALPMGLAAARRHNIKAHRRTMTSLFMVGLLVAGLFTFLPGRMIWSIFFGA